MEEASNPDFIGHNYIDINPFSTWSTHDPLSQFLIKFTFSCFSYYTEWVESEEYTSFLHFLSQYSRPEADKFIVLNLHQFLDNQEFCQVMSPVLRDLPLTQAQREKLMLSARTQAREYLVLMPSNHNILNLHLRVNVMHRHVIRREDQDLIMNRVMQESFDAAAVTMPAAETAVEMVMGEKVGPNEMETCTICLEEVVEGVQMPCSHVFHDDCIGEWLRIDHRCPLCRFEMPVAIEV